MDYKNILADVIVYSIKNIDMADFDYNITMDEVYKGEKRAHSALIKHIESLLSGEKNPKGVESSMALIREVLSENGGRKSN